ncbi:hypothetical protein [Streptomyces sp. NPDC059850]|uniref:hypothetical protein n=1 Tax=Streptomyces sp. NPDC059850 TaxID=3346970 RepID=UPI00365A3C30
MSRGEEEDEPIAGGGYEMSKETIESPPPDFTVTISSDGSAAIDGEPVLAGEGEAVDSAIIDILQGYAQARDASVTAAISDTGMGYRTLVEVAPDGSSRLVEEPREASTGPAEAPPVPPPSAGDDHDTFAVGIDDRDSDPDAGKYALPQPAMPSFTPPSLRSSDSGPSVSPPSKIGRSSTSRQSDDEYEPPGLFQRPLVVGTAAAAVLALVVVGSVVMLTSGGSSDGGDRTQAVGSESKPSKTASDGKSAKPKPSATPSRTPKPSKTPTADTTRSPKPSDSPKPSEKPGGPSGPSGPSGPNGGADDEESEGPRRETAATAVKRLSDEDPSGRHICYRAYVDGQGWQKPECDGAMAGVAERNRPIKSLNIAVYGVDGSSANAFIEKPNSSDGKGGWEPQWTPVMDDGKDNYIGTTSEDAPKMLGFAINVGTGQVCQSTRLRESDWRTKGCAKARPNLIFGGSLKNGTWLEAVKLTV